MSMQTLRINDMQEVYLKLTGHSPQNSVEDDQSSEVLEMFE